MATTYEYIGQEEQYGEWFSASSYFVGPATKANRFIGQTDALGEWFAPSHLYLGPALRSCPWLGQSDAGGAWFGNSIKYVGQVTTNLFPKTLMYQVGSGGGATGQTGSDWHNLNYLVGSSAFYCTNTNKAGAQTAYVNTFGGYDTFGHFTFTGGFQIPSNAVITGIWVEYVAVGYDVHGSGIPSQLNVSLETTPGVPYGAVKSAPVQPSSTTLSGTVLGGETDTWSATLTPAIVNSANFGVGFEVDPSLGAYGTGVQWVQMVVYYYIPSITTTNAAFAAVENVWLPATYMFTRDYWGTLATPYAGQLFPTGGSNQNTPGQCYPF